MAVEGFCRSRIEKADRIAACLVPGMEELHSGLLLECANTALSPVV
jgi:hypothetical protein